MAAVGAVQLVDPIPEVCLDHRDAPGRQRLDDADLLRGVALRFDERSPADHREDLVPGLGGGCGDRDGAAVLSQLLGRPLHQDIEVLERIRLDGPDPLLEIGVPFA